MNEEYELSVQLENKYPLGTELTFWRTDGSGQAIGWVNGTPIMETIDDELHTFVPVYWARRDQTVYVNIKNIVENR